MSTTVHHSTHTHMGTSYALKYMLMVMVWVKTLTYQIHANLMKGDYDNNLQWPFEGDMLYELLNWREDNHHYRGDTLSF